MRRASVAILLAAASLPLSAQQSNPSAPTNPHSNDPQVSQSPPTPFIRQIDHIMIVSDTPEALFHLFSGQLELPLGFPYKSYGTFSSGGVGFGNVIIEFIHLKDLHPGLTGVAFEPATIEEAASTLDSEGIKHGPAQPTYQPDPSEGRRLGWTTMDLDLPADGFFLCKYNMSVEPRRARIRSELDAREGGPLGIDSVSEVVVGVRDLLAAQAQFRSLLGPPSQGKASVWALGVGPAIRLVTDKQDHLKEVRVKVHSLEKARGYLKDQSLLAGDSGRELSLDSPRFGETGIVLVR